MRVLHLVQGYAPAIGGTEFLVQNISEKLVEYYGDEVRVLTTNGYNCEVFNTFGQKTMAPGEEEINGVSVKRLKVFNKTAPFFNLAQKALYRPRLPFNHWARTLYSGPILPGIIPEIIKADADVVSASSFPLMHMHYAGAIKRLKKIPLVLIGGLHPEDKWGFKRKNIYKAIRNADAYIAYSTYEKEYLIEKGIEPKKIHVIGVGIDSDLYENADGSDLKKKYGLNGNPVVTFLGQQGGHKGIETLVESMAPVWDKIPDASLIIAGARTNYSSTIDDIISKLDKDRQKKVILITGFDEREKADILAASDLLASPSGYESFGITYIEAWAAKKPVIGCRSGAVPTVIDENMNGLLVDYKDKQELTGAILELIQDKRYSSRLAESGYKKFQQNYTWEIVAERFRDVYKQVAKRADGKTR